MPLGHPFFLLFSQNGKTLREDLEKPYVVRGENRERLKTQGRAEEWTKKNNDRESWRTATAILQ